MSLPVRSSLVLGLLVTLGCSVEEETLSSPHTTIQEVVATSEQVQPGSESIGYSYLWGTSNMGQGAGALAWLMGDVDGDGRKEIIQPWNNGGTLGMLVYRWNGWGYATAWGTSNMGQGSGALAWLKGDVDGDGKTEIIQPWNNWGWLGMLVYRWNGWGYATAWGTSNMGQGAGALAWLTGDVDGDGKTEIIQPWNNGGTLGMLVYKWNGWGYATAWGTSNMGQGAGALAWLTGDVDGDGKTEIIQPWDNGGTLGMLVYKWNGSGYVTAWGTSNMGQGAGALAWLTGDVDGDGRTEIIQPWSNGGTLGMIVYKWNGSGYVTAWGTSNMGQGAGALAWLTGDVDGDGRTEIIQPWNSWGWLGMLVYKWNGSGYTTAWGTSNIGQGAGAVAWLMGDVNGDRGEEFIQPWNNWGNLGLIVYQYSN